MGGGGIVSLTIGRVGADITLSETSGWQERSDGTVEMRGWMSNATVAQVEHLRDQFLGLTQSTDEPIVYVSVGHDDSRNGWYEVLDTDVEHVLGATETRGDRQWRCRVRRTPWWDQPRLELFRAGGVVTNVHSITTSTHTGFIGIPTSAEAVDSGTDTGTLTRATRVAETGSMAFITGSGTGATLYDTVVSYDLAGSDAYDGAATVEVDLGSSTYRPAVGRAVRREHKTGWRLNNGLIRAKWNTTNHGIDMDIYTGGAWETMPETFIPTDDNVHTAIGEDPISWAVLRNDPAMVAIRLVFDYEAGTSRILLDLAVRRGDRNLIGVLKSRTSAKYGLKLSTGQLGTALTGGIERNGDDANGNTFTIALPKTTTDDLTSCEVYLTTASQVFPFGLGCVLGGSTASGQNTGQNTVYQYYAQPIETMAVSGI